MVNLNHFDSIVMRLHKLWVELRELEGFVLGIRDEAHALSPPCATSHAIEILFTNLCDEVIVRLALIMHTEINLFGG